MGPRKSLVTEHSFSRSRIPRCDDQSLREGPKFKSLYTLESQINKGDVLIFQKKSLKRPIFDKDHRFSKKQSLFHGKRKSRITAMFITHLRAIHTNLSRFVCDLIRDPNDYLDPLPPFIWHRRVQSIRMGMGVKSFMEKK